VNCWNVATSDSSEMWDTFVGECDGVAVVSSFTRLVESLEASEQSIRLSLVSYIDHLAHITDRRNPFDYVLLKRYFFNFEQELRAIYFPPIPTIADVNPDPTPLINPFDPEHRFVDPSTLSYVEQVIEAEAQNEKAGYEIKVDLNRLLEQVYVSPKSESFLIQLLREQLNQVDIKQVPILHSSLRE
jgi:hypothetical protein